MDEAAALAAAGEPEGIVVVANEQTAGRGRAGRTWMSPPGSSLLCSIFLRPSVPPERLAPLALVAGVAVAEAIESFGPTPTLKWPNDVWLNDRKVAGILVTSRTGPDGIVAILGVGINIGASMSDLPDGATSLRVAAGSAPDRDDLLAVLLDRIDRGYAAFITSGGYPDLSGWTDRAALLGEEVMIRDGTTTHQGVFAAIDGDGALLLRDHTGHLIRIVAGDLTRGPILSPEIG